MQKKLSQISQISQISIQVVPVPLQIVAYKCPDQTGTDLASLLTVVLAADMDTAARISEWAFHSNGDLCLLREQRP